jgi:PKD domain
MIKTLAAATALTAAALSLTTQLALAAPDLCGGPLTQQSCWETEDGTITGGRRIVATQPGETGHAGSASAVNATQNEAEDDMVAAYCADARRSAAAAGTALVESEFLCHGLAPLPSTPSASQVLSAFRELGLYRGAVRSDPGRASFVNLETYFWCGDGGQTCNALGEGERTVTLLGQAVRIRPRIVSYEWRFGDGSSERVTAGRVAHTYGHTGAMAVSVTLTWTADYAVGGGGFRPIGGTTTTTSPVRVLPVQEAQTINHL